jgi:hypothetical protein
LRSPQTTKIKVFVNDQQDKAIEYEYKWYELQLVLLILSNGSTQVLFKCSSDFFGTDDF